MTSKTRAAVAAAVRSVVEPLEVRRLLSGAEWSVELSRGLLLVAGTEGDDDVAVRPDPADDARVQVVVDDEVVRTFDADAVSRVVARGLGGDDTIRVGLSAGVRAVLVGGAGDDQLVGGAGADDLRGNAGHDTLEGGGDDDLLYGGAGDDSIAGGAGDDRIFAGAGDDRVVGGGGDDSVRGQAGADSVAGGIGRDTLRGNGGDDEIAGGVEDDVLLGQVGADTIFGGQGRDTIAGGAAADVLHVERNVDRTKGSKYDTINNDRYRNPLKLLRDQEGLKAWIIEEAVEQWKGYFGQRVWHPWYRVYYAAIDSTGGVEAGPVARDHSTTNVQEQGVDEADLVKTDGEYLYLVSQGELVIVDAWPASEMHVVSRTAVAGDLSGIYLHGDTLTVVSSGYKSNAPEEGTARRGYWRGWSVPQTKITVLDVSDRSAPEVVEETTLDGSHGDTRMIDGRLYVVVNDWDNLPAPRVIEMEPEGDPEPQEEPDPGSAVGKVAIVYDPPVWESDDRYETEAEFRARLDATPLEELLPGFVTKFGDAEIEGRLADFSNFYVPDEQDERKYSGNMFSVVMFDVTDDEVGVKSSTSVAGLNGQVYASTDSLYVTATTWDRPIRSWGWSGETQTDIYKFDLGIDRVKLGGSGQVPGWIVNQFSLDEEDGILRIATTSNREDGQSNNVFTLADVGKELNIVGGITDLAFTERIYSVRFVGDRGYIVTFRQVDPLFTIDLSDPENPEVKGILKIPGYSSYLHPIGEDLLLGVGRDGTDAGQVLGVQVSLFDVSDMENPKRLHSHAFEEEGQWRGGSWSAAEWDHHAFSYFADQQILALPMMTGGYDWEGTGVGPKYGLHVLHVDRESGFTALGNVEHVGQAPLRSVRIENALYSIGYDAIRVVELADPSNVLKVLESVIEPSHWLRGGMWWLGGPILILEA